MTKVFKYYPKDFGELTVKVLHMNLDFDMFDKHTDVTSHLKVKTKENIKELVLDAKNLEIHEISCNISQCTYDYKKDQDKLVIKFEKEIEKGKEIIITTKTTCHPTQNILEGIYYDETPKNCPCQQITQCQQWGFQRIVPCLDDMTAKCTYTTTITADERYTNLISNGDVKENIQNAGNGRKKITYNNNITPMATYLFFLGIGTYATFKKELEYPNGDKFQLELLVPPDSEKEIAEHALEVLHDGILWIHMFTGPERYEQNEKRKEVWELLKQRQQLKKDNNQEQLKEIQKEIKEESKSLKLGYKYTGTVYREIGMQNSDFGGMENVGNTTISTNRIMPFKQMTDGSFEYMIAVKVHEFYHNLNGSEVTGWSPFEIWLNEAVTVFIENWNHAFLFGEDYERLGTVLGILAPTGGTLVKDEGATSMPIEPDGFNDCNELITGITYVKAPEFVRMIETLLGKEKFVQALDNYHNKYTHGNAKRQDWIEEMQKVYGKSLENMAQVWLKQTAYPKVDITTNYDEEKRTYTLKLKQRLKDQKAWEFPLVIALVDKDGNDLQEQTYFIQNEEETITFNEVDNPAFPSINRGYSFYGKVFHDASEEQLYLQVKKDKDIINRFMAFKQIMDNEKLALLEGKDGPNEKAIDLYFELLSDRSLMDSVSIQILALFESVEDERFAHHYDKLHEVQKTITTAIAKKYKEQLLEIYNTQKDKTFEGYYTNKKILEIKARQVKNLALGLLSRLEEQDIYDLIKKQFNEATNATDKIIAFSLYINSKAEDKMQMIQEYEQEAKQHLVSWETFLSVIASNDSDDALEIIKNIENGEDFRLEQTNDQRALYARFAMNKKKSLLTEQGRDFLKKSIIKLAQINEYTTGHLLTVFGNLDKIEEKHQVPLVNILNDVLKTLDQEKTPSVFNTINRILAGNPNAVNLSKN